MYKQLLRRKKKKKTDHKSKYFNKATRLQLYARKKNATRPPCASLGWHLKKCQGNLISGTLLSPGSNAGTAEQLHSLEPSTPFLSWGWAQATKGGKQACPQYIWPLNHGSCKVCPKAFFKYCDCLNMLLSWHFVKDHQEIHLPLCLCVKWHLAKTDT